MKRLAILSLTTLCCGIFALQLNAAEGLSLDNFTIKAGETKTVKVNKTSSQPTTFTGFQFTITAPEGLTIESVSPNSGFSGNFTFSSADNASGDKVVILYALPNGSSVPSSNLTEGILDITLTASKDVEDKDTETLTFSNVIFTGTDVNSNKFTFENSVCTVTYENEAVTDVTITPGAGNSDPDDPDNPDNPDGPYGQDPDNQDPEKPNPEDPAYPKHESNSSNYFELFVGETITFSANVNENATLTEITWAPSQSTTDLGITIEGNSITIAAKAISTQATTITATAYNQTAAEIQVKVVPMPIMSVSINTDADKTDVDIDSTLQLNALVKPSVTYTGPVTLEWTTEDEYIEVNESTGVVTGKKAGEATVTVTAQSEGGDSKDATIQITVNPIVAQNVAITSLYHDKQADRHNLKVGDKLDLTATVTPANTSFPEVEWTVNPSNIASVEEGILIAKEKGSATVTATVISTKGGANPVSATYDITVEDVLYGDANDDKAVDVSDVIVVAYYIVELPADNFSFVNADVIQDDKIDIADQQEISDIALGISKNYNNNQFVGNVNSYISNDHVVADDYNVGNGGNIEVGVRLENAPDYKSLQADFVLPEGMKVATVAQGKALDGHSLMYNVTDAGILKVVLFSMDGKAFKDEALPLFTIMADVERNCGNLEIENVIALSTDSDKYELEGEGGTRVDIVGIEGVNANELNIVAGHGFIEVSGETGGNIAVYDMTGKTLGHASMTSNTTRINMAPGIYLVKVNDTAKRVIVK
ncbi:MAG: Ig-like domain-containing protein [Muribaculaceae bacterium]|nr:Ig-like domain-containing protein [Muribaculaceae bacterium]